MTRPAVFAPGEYVNTACGQWPVVVRVDALCSAGDVMVGGVRRAVAGLRHATEEELRQVEEGRAWAPEEIEQQAKACEFSNGGDDLHHIASMLRQQSVALTTAHEREAALQTANARLTGELAEAMAACADYLTHAVADAITVQQAESALAAERQKWVTLREAVSALIIPLDRFTGIYHTGPTYDTELQAVKDALGLIKSER